MTIVRIHTPAVKWRVFEKQAVEKYFGKIIDISLMDPDLVNKVLRSRATTVLWKISPDELTFPEYNVLSNKETWYALEGLSHINHPKGFLNTYDKSQAFFEWNRLGIPCPQHKILSETKKFSSHYLSSISVFPYLIRLNNGVGGKQSYFVQKKEQVQTSLRSLQQDFNQTHNQKPFTKQMWVEYIDTNARGYNVSYRIIVAGNRIVAGYARLSSPKDWIAITGKFTLKMANMFVYYQQRCKKLCKDNYELIIGAVHGLGVNHQGVDIIEDKNGKLYFLELQAGYSTGYENSPPFCPPYYNPHYPVLVKFLQNNETDLKKKIPMYYKYWLDKKCLFDLAYEALWGYLND